MIVIDYLSESGEWRMPSLHEVADPTTCPRCESKALHPEFTDSLDPPVCRCLDCRHVWTSKADPRPDLREVYKR